MKKYKFLSILVSFVILLSASLLPAQARTPEPNAETESEPAWSADLAGFRTNNLPQAQSYEANCDTALLLELNSGIVVYSKNAESKVYPASLTKIMTCLVALQYASQDMDKVVTVSETALAGIAEAGGDVRLQVGERLPLRDVLYYLMVSSTNEAGNVIAEYVASDIPSFVSLMNKTAEELGCTGTHFSNTHGLHDPSHYTTARDLSIITRKALTYTLFREITSTAEYTVPATNLSEAKKISSTNLLIVNNAERYLGDDGNYYPYYREGVSGIKTGYTGAAGRCVIARLSDGNMDLLCVIMGAQTRMMKDGSVRYDNFVEAKKIFSYGFDNYSFAKVAVGGIEPMFQKSVEYSMDKRGVVLVPSTDVNCLLPKDYDKSKVATECVLNRANGLVAPLERGEKVGVLNVTYDGVVIGSTDMETLTAVEEQRVDRAIADITGRDKKEEERTMFQRLIAYWYIPCVLIFVLFLCLVLRNALFQIRRRRSMERRRQFAMKREAEEAQEAREARRHREELSEQSPSAWTNEPTRRNPRQGDEL
ncbi:MAG: D-alanyl-D-alanine carboxypeptidase [Oscillospiraceae bacterium]|nr:D-alanyl-D-alanine carboxypeptidase [Oscillospiraceae bacterium]